MKVDNINSVAELQDYIEANEYWADAFKNEETYNEWMNHLDEAILRIRQNDPDYCRIWNFNIPLRFYRGVPSKACQEHRFGQSWTTDPQNALQFGDNLYYIDIDDSEPYVCWHNGYDGGLIEVIIANVEKKYEPKLFKAGEDVAIINETAFNNETYKKLKETINK